MTNENTPEVEVTVTPKEQKTSKVKEKFEKVKSWCKEHKGEIIKDALFIGAGAAAVVIAKVATGSSDDEIYPIEIDDSLEVSDLQTDENGQKYYAITPKSSDDDNSEESDDSNVESTEE